MMKRGLLVAWFWFFGISVFAQEDPVLMRVNGKDILRSEFEYSYRHRTGNADAKLSPKEYAELFAQSKLKVEAAKVAGLDTTTMFRKLQEAWRSQLLKSYLTDKQVLDSCIRVLYQDRGLKGLGSRVRIMQVFQISASDNNCQAFGGREKPNRFYLAVAKDSVRFGFCPFGGNVLGG